MANKSLPNTYIKLKYLHSNNGAYIMLPYYPTGDTCVQFNCKVDAYTGWIYGTRTGYRDRAYGLACHFNGNEEQNFFNYGSDYSVFNQILSTTEYHDYEQRKNVFYRDGVQVGMRPNVESFSCADKLIIYGCYMDGTIQRFTNTSFKYFKVYNNYNGTLLCDLLPAKRISDSVLGMYDLVNNVFYTNQGSGSFDGEIIATVTTSANTDGIKIVVLSEEPATRYEGWIYIIMEE